VSVCDWERLGDREPARRRERASGGGESAAARRHPQKQRRPRACSKKKASNASSTLCLPILPSVIVDDRAGLRVSIGCRCVWGVRGQARRHLRRRRTVARRPRLGAPPLAAALPPLPSLSPRAPRPRRLTHMNTSLTAFTGVTAPARRGAAAGARAGAATRRAFIVFLCREKGWWWWWTQEISALFVFISLSQFS
jgi:hypothetical protein